MNSEHSAWAQTPARDILLRLGLVLAGLFLACLSVSPEALAQENPKPAAAAPSATIGIAAIVNDHIISRYDLQQRAMLFMVTSGIPPTPENLNRIEGQVLRTLIDETLQVQEAERVGIKADPKEVQAQLAAIAARANITTEQVFTILERGGISPDTMIEQIRADTVWNNLVSQRFGGQVTVRTEEIDDVMRQLESEADEPRYEISEIYLTYDSPQQETEIANGAQRLVEEIRRGAPFDAVARQFSHSASAANGGDIGWVHLSQLPADIAPYVKDMPSGTISDPIKASGGYYIIALRNKQASLSGPDPMRDVYALMHIVFPLSPDAPSSAVDLRAQQVSTFVKQFQGCQTAAEQVKKYVGAKVEGTRQVEFGQLDPKLREELSKTSVDGIVKPIRTQMGIEMVAVCDHQKSMNSMPTRTEIEQNIFGQQLAMLSRRYLRDLRHDAVIEYR